MRRTLGVIGLIGTGVSFFAWMMLIFTGACFDDHGFSIWVPIVFMSFATSIVLSIVCWAKDLLCFIGRCLGLRDDEK